MREKSFPGAASRRSPFKPQLRTQGAPLWLWSVTPSATAPALARPVPRLSSAAVCVLAALSFPGGAGQPHLFSACASCWGALCRRATTSVQEAGRLRLGRRHKLEVAAVRRSHQQHLLVKARLSARRAHWPSCKRQAPGPRAGPCNRPRKFCVNCWLSVVFFQDVSPTSCFSCSVMSGLRDPMDSVARSPGRSVRGISQARILEWTAVFFSKCYFLSKCISHKG